MGQHKPGTKSPTFTLVGMDGRPCSFQDALARGPLLVAFFKVGCPTCQYALPFLERLHQQFREHGAQVWGISQDDARSSRSFAEEFGLTFPILIDDHPYDVSDAYGIRHVPTLFLINGQGLVELATDGFDKKDLLAIQHWFARGFSVSPPALFLPTERVPEFKPG
jgi:peroxiredoxin